MVHLLFTCVENACRSQMAEGFARSLGGEEVEVSSGGSEPADEISENAVRAMQEIGVDISSQEPTAVSSAAAESADYVITMGCGPEACPVPVSGRVLEWNIEDPAGESMEKFRKARDKIEEKIRALLKDISE